MSPDRQNLRRGEAIVNKEDFRLIWFDPSIDQSADSLQTQSMLLEVNPAAQFYTDSTRCLDLIKSTTDERILFITSGAVARIILPQLDQFSSIVAVFIFCSNRDYHLPLINEFPKIVDLFTDQDELFQSLRQVLTLLQQHMITFSLFDQKQKSARDSIFLWHQILFYIFKLPQDEQAKADLLETCQTYYQFDRTELAHIEQFQREYHPSQAIQWYTRECFLFKLLNKALRTEDIDLIYTFRFFIIDLCSQIKQEHERQKLTTDHFVVYRGQHVSNAERKKWKEDTTISINTFFSTSRDRNVALDFARAVHPTDDLSRILFEIEVDPSLKDILYADITHLSHARHEREVLFNLSSLFRIVSIQSDTNDEIWHVRLTTTDEGAHLVDRHRQSVQQQIDEGSPIICFGWLLLKELGQVDRAEKYFRMLLKTLPTGHSDIAAVYNGLGTVHAERNEWNLALDNYQEAYKLSSKPSNRVASLQNMANIFRDKKDFGQALDYYQQALGMEQCNHPDDHLQKAAIIENIGIMYIDKDDSDTALEYLSQALGILQRLLPEQHPKTSTCLGYIGLAYETKKDWTKALEYYHQEYQMDEQCLPPDHPHLSKDLQKIVAAYLKNDQANEALAFCREKLKRQQSVLGEHHPNLARISMVVARIFEEKSLRVTLGFYQEALSHLEKSVPIDQQTMAKCRTFIGRAYSIHKQFDKALEYHHQALDAYRLLLPSDHIDIGTVCRNIGLCYMKTKDFTKALEYFNESLAIYQVNYGVEYRTVKLIEEDIRKLSTQEPTAISSPELAEETASDEQLITVIIDSDPCVTSTEPSVLPVMDSVAVSQPDFSETKAAVKRKRCSSCQIL